LHGLVAALADRGVEITVAAAAAPGIPSESVEGGIDVRRSTGGRVAFARHISETLGRTRPDLAISQYSATAPTVWAAHRASIPALAVVHDVYGLRESLRIKGVTAGVLRHVGLERSLRWLRPDAFLVNSRSTAALLRRVVGGGPITVVPAGADHLLSAAAVEGARSGVVFVGRLVPRKGVADLLEAVRILSGRGISTTVTIVGDGPEGPRLRDIAAGLGASVRFAGRLDDAGLEEALGRAEMLALPSTREGWGLAITESAARATPYVAYDIPAVREQHEELRGGVLVGPGPGPLAEALGRLLTDPAEARRLGERGRAAAAGMTWAKAAEVAEGAIRDAVDAFEGRRSGAREG
jgi:glycosyltransferase involved in cell wall biosynthesis